MRKDAHNYFLAPYSPAMHRFVEWYLVIRPEKISWLRFILEGYDGLAVLSTISARTGLVLLRAPISRYGEAMALIAELAADLSPFRVPKKK